MSPSRPWCVFLLLLLVSSPGVALFAGNEPNRLAGLTNRYLDAYKAYLKAKVAQDPQASQRLREYNDVYAEYMAVLKGTPIDEKGTTRIVAPPVGNPATGIPETLPEARSPGSAELAVPPAPAISSAAVVPASPTTVLPAAASVAVETVVTPDASGTTPGNPVLEKIPVPLEDSVPTATGSGSPAPAPAPIEPPGMTASGDQTGVASSASPSTGP